MTFKKLRKHSDNIDQDIHDDFEQLDREEKEEELAKHKLDIDMKKEKVDEFEFPGSRSTIIKP